MDVKRHAIRRRLFAWVGAVLGMALSLTMLGTSPAAAADPKLTLTKTSVGGTALVPPGGSIDYSLTLRVTGAATTDSAVVTDTLPPYLTYDATHGFTATTSTGVDVTDEWSVSTSSDLVFTHADALALGTNVTIAFRATVSADDGAYGQTLTNTAIATSGSFSSTTVTHPRKTTSHATLTLTKGSEGTGAVDPGDPLVYTLKLTTTVGPTVGTTYVVDTLPDHVLYDGTVPFTATDRNGLDVTDDWQIDVSGQTVTFSCASSLATGSQVTIRFGTTVEDVEAAYGASLVNTAVANDDFSTSKQVSHTRTGTKPPTLALTKSSVTESGATRPKPGEDITYTLKLTTSAGPTIDTTTVTDTLPKYLLYKSSAGYTVTDKAGNDVTADWNLDVSGQEMVFSYAGILPAASAMTIVFTTTVEDVPEAYDQQLLNTATAESKYATPKTATNSRTVATAPNLLVTKVSDGTAELKPGDKVQYRVTLVTKARTAAKTTTTVTDTLPEYLTYDSTVAWTPGDESGWTLNSAGQVLTFSNPNQLPAGTSVTFTFTAIVSDSEDAYGATVVNTAVAASGAMTANDNASDTRKIVQPGKLVVTKSSGGSDPVVPGQHLDYVVTVTTVGGSTVGTTTVVDTLPSLLTYDSAGGYTAKNGEDDVDCALTPSGQELTFTCDDEFPEGTTLTFRFGATVAATGDVYDKDIENCVKAAHELPLETAADVCDTRHTVKQATLTLGKTSAGTGYVQPGGTLQYTLVLTVDDGATTGTTTVVDTLPAHTSYRAADAFKVTLDGADVTGSWQLVPSGRTLTFTTNGVLAAGSEIIITFTANVGSGQAAYGQVLENKATAADGATLEPLTAVDRRETTPASAATVPATSDSATATATATASATPEDTETAEPTGTPTPTESAGPSISAGPTATGTPAPTVSVTESSLPTPSTSGSSTPSSAAIGKPVMPQLVADATCDDKTWTYEVVVMPGVDYYVNGVLTRGRFSLPDGTTGTVVARPQPGYVLPAGESELIVGVLADRLEADLCGTSPTTEPSATDSGSSPIMTASGGAGPNENEQEPNPSLPLTGTPVGVIILLAGALTALGGASVFVRRRAQSRN